MNIGINKFQTRVCFTVEYINNNATGRDILGIGLSQGRSQGEHCTGGTCSTFGKVREHYSLPLEALFLMKLQNFLKSLNLDEFIKNT